MVRWHNPREQPMNNDRHVRMSRVLRRSSTCQHGTGSPRTEQRSNVAHKNYRQDVKAFTDSILSSGSLSTSTPTNHSFSVLLEDWARRYWANGVSLLLILCIAGPSLGQYCTTLLGTLVGLCQSMGSAVPSIQKEKKNLREWRI